MVSRVIKVRWLGCVVAAIVTAGCSVHTSIPLGSPACTIFVTGSCIAGRDDTLWSEIASIQPDAVILTGDTVYLSQEQMSSQELARAAYRANFDSPSFRTLRKHTPIFAAIDDHDFGPDNSDSGNPWSEITVAAFQQFWRAPESAERGPAPLSYYVAVGGVDILVTDGRSHRVNGGPLKTLFGEAQWGWISSHLSKRTSVPLIFVSGTPLLAEDTSRESLAQFEGDRTRLYSLLEGVTRPFAIVSGDAHFGEMNEISFGERKVVEISASPLHAPVRPAESINENKHRVAGPLAARVIGLLKVCQHGGETHFRGELRSRESAERHVREWDWR